MGEVIRLGRHQGAGDSQPASLGTLRRLTGMEPGAFAAAIAAEAGQPVGTFVYLAYEDGEPVPAAILAAARHVAARTAGPAVARGERRQQPGIAAVPHQPGPGPAGALHGPGRAEGLVPGTGEDGDDVRRRDFLALTGSVTAVLGTLGTFNPDMGERLGTCRDTGRVDAETCKGLANVMLGYRQVYRSASPASLLAPVSGALQLLIEMAPGSGRYRDTMVSLIGQAYALAGAVLMFDLDDFAAAKESFSISARAARQAGDDELMAIVLACRAFHAAYSGNPQAGVEFAQGALDTAASGIHPRSHGWVAAVASEMHATLGPSGKAGCTAALDIAGEQLARPMPEQPWAGIGAFDEGKLAAYRGGDFMRLGDYASAQVQLQAALDKLSPAFAKHRCTAHIDLAEAYAYDGEAGQASVHASSALEIISSTRHADSLRRVQDIYSLTRASGTAEARDLGARLLEFKATS